MTMSPSILVVENYKNNISLLQWNHCACSTVGPWNFLILIYALLLGPGISRFKNELLVKNVSL